MSRELKFRAWHNELKLMLYPPHQLDSMPYCRPHTKFNSEDYLPAIMDWDGNWFVHGKLQDAVIMQYTGLLDKNGKEIYESDILRCTYNLDTKTTTSFTQTVEYESLPDGIGFGIPVKMSIEVIGNIWENKDLLT